MNADAATISLIIARLENIRTRPHCFLSIVQVDAAVPFLDGFSNSLHAVGLEMPHHVKSQVLVEHGWESSARGPWHEMQARNMAAAAIVDELLMIEIDSWKRFAESLPPSGTPPECGVGGGLVFPLDAGAGGDQ